ncbi:MAG: hypothetical protein GY832_07960 [Chloroflexi bacterium]|nr:hypothetical protein [Chloroflexota bacterium]
MSRKNWIIVIVLLIYLVIAVGMTWPLILDVNAHLPGGSQDTYLHYWNGWWAKRALSTGQSPYYTSYLYHPSGLSLVYHNFAWMSIVTWRILEPLVGGFAAYNFSILINLALCGLAAFLLAYELTNDRRAAFLAGLTYQCWPFRLSQLDHPNLISTLWIPIFLLFLIRTVRQGKRQHAVLTGVFLALVGYTRWQLLIPAAIMASVYLICTLPNKVTLRQRWVPALMIAGSITVLALAPPALMLIRQQSTTSTDLLREDEEVSLQTDLLAYLTPSASHPVLESLTRPAYDRYYANRPHARRFSAYIGVTVMALALFGVYKARRISLPWIAMAITMILLALGPVLRFNGQVYPGVPMPYRLAARLYVVRLVRLPDRFTMFLALPMAMLAAYGTTRVLAFARQRGGRASFAVPYLLGGIILFEYLLVPMDLRHPSVSEFYHQLSAESGDFAVLNLPVSAVDSKKYMLAQVTHQHPLVQGNTSRFPPGIFDYLSEHPWMHALCEFGTKPPEHTDVSRQLATLVQDDVKYIILHKNSNHPLRLDHWRHYFLVPPQFEDERILVYPTAPQAGRDLILTNELSPGIGLIRVITPTDCLIPGQPLNVQIGWGAITAPGQDWNVKLSLAADGETHHEQVFPLSENWPTGEWPANAVAWGHYALQVPPSLPGNIYSITLMLVDPATGLAQDQSVIVGRVAVNESACVLPIPPDATRVNALFGNELRLLGYQLQREQAQLTLKLHWRSEHLIKTDYVIFVHVLDPDTGLRVAQDDSMPRRWSYPTTYWDSGEIVSDAIPLSLENAPSGAYSVVVGVYDSETKKRLSVIAHDGQPQPDDQIVLPGDKVEVGTKEP